MPERTKAPSLNWEMGRSIYVEKAGAEDGRYLFRRQLREAERHCEEASRLIGAQGGSRDVNTVIGISGERGSGKSSFLHSLKNSLCDNYHVLDIVDPSDFDSELSILEHFLASLFRAYEDLYPEYERLRGELSALSLHGKFKSLTKTLSSLRIDKSVYNDENPSVEVLSNLADRIKIRKSIAALCADYLLMVNDLEKPGRKKDSIVLCVDDIDLVENAYAYRMLDDMRKFLSGNVVLVVAYREQQLFNTILDKKYRENSLLIDRDIIRPEELQDQTHRYLAKLFPEMRVVHLPGQAELLSKPIGEVLEALGERGRTSVEEDLIDGYSAFGGRDPRGISLKEWVDTVLYEKIFIRIDPVNSLERSFHYYPRNLRETISFVELVHNMALPLIGGEMPDGISFVEPCLGNLEGYRAHLLSTVSEILSSEQVTQITSWSILPAEKKNHFAYRVFFDSFLQLRAANDHEDIGIADVEGLLAISFVSPENVCVGDVCEVMNRYEGAASGDDAAAFFAYTFKMLYSIELLSLFLQAIAHEGAPKASRDSQNKPLGDYLGIVKGCINSPYSAFTSAVKEFYYPKEDCSKETERAFDLLLNTFGFTHLTATGNVLPSACPRLGVAKENISPGYRKRAVYFYDLENGGGFAKGNTYWVDPLSMIAKRRYVGHCIESLLEPCDHPRGFYILYSLFDIDAFQSLTLDQHASQSKEMNGYLRRYNTAIRLGASNGKRVRFDKNDRLTIRIRDLGEVLACRHLCTKFVKEPDYLLFPDHGLAPSPDTENGGFEHVSLFDSVCDAYATSVAIKEQSAPSEKDRRIMIAFIEGMSSKGVFLPFANILSELLSEPEQKSLRDRLNAQIDRMGQRNRSITQADRQLLRQMLDAFPETFMEAYARCEQR